MFIRKYWLPIAVLLVAICGVFLYYLQTRPSKAPIKIDDPVEVEQPTTQAPSVGDTSQGGHFHENGTFHADPHETHEVPNSAIPAQPPVAASRDYTPAVVKIPEGITDPDVLAAWQRVDYIANNIWEWGGCQTLKRLNSSRSSYQLPTVFQVPPDTEMPKKQLTCSLALIRMIHEPQSWWQLISVKVLWEDYQ